MKLLLIVACVALAGIGANAQSCTEIMNCNSCSNPGPLCYDCGDSYVLSQDRTKCIPCGTGCSECTSDANDVVTCVDCMDSYYLAAGSCTYCGDGCMECHVDSLGSIICDTCFAEDFAQDMSTPAQSCTACPTNCKYCSMQEDLSTKCSECYSYQGFDIRGYFLVKSDATCKSCPSNCARCTDNGSGVGICTSCYSNYVGLVDESDSSKDDTKCIRCPSGCSTCNGVEFSSSIATCESCNPNLGLYLSSGECIECDPNCDTCDGEGLCVNCNEYYRLETGSCSVCPAFCQQCAVDETTGDESCSACNNKYGFKAGISITCDACGISNCKTCSRSVDGSMSCNMCKAGYNFDSNSACTKCPTGCASCTYSTDHWRCDSCSTGYTATVYPATGSSALADPSRCGQCASNCETCDFDGSGVNNCGSCTDIATHYVSTSGGPNTCEAMPANCVAGDGANDDCDVCAAGYRLNAGVCDPCTLSRNCLTCATDAAVCETCEDGWALVITGVYPTNDTDACESCSISSCTKCFARGSYAGNPKKCMACKPGYVVMDTNTQSTTLGTSCKKCPTGCETCTVDYAANNKAMCTSSGCYGWVSSTKKAYAYSENGACKVCPTNCVECTYDSSSDSTSCVDGQCSTGYILNPDSGECEVCPDNCASCDWSVEFSTPFCQLGFCDTTYGLISDGSCQSCPNNCDDCTISDSTDADDTLFCDTCADAYVKNDDVCGACPSYCSECTDLFGTMTCTMCNDGYALDSNSNCAKCPSNCEVCTAKGTLVCSDCKTGYSLMADKTGCLDCPSATFDFCSECSSIDVSTGLSECEECQFGYTLEDEMGNLSCKDASFLDCVSGDYEDNGPECSVCGDGYTLTDDFMCAIACYICGDVDMSMYVPTTECVIPAAGSNSTENAAELEYCDNGICYAAYLNGQVMAGCLPESNEPQECAGAMADGESCSTTQTDARCEQCCTTDNCNSFVDNLDGLPDSATSVSVSLALMLAAAFAAMWRQ